MSQELVDKLKSTVDKLEARVAELESRLTGGNGGASGGSGGGSSMMRMILMGPPGAGTFNACQDARVAPRRARLTWRIT